MDAWMGWMLWFLATWLLGTLTGLLVRLPLAGATLQPLTAIAHADNAPPCRAAQLPRPKVPLVDVTSSWKGAILGEHSLLIVR